MLPKFKRLNLKRSFKWVASGNKIDTPFFKIMYQFGENDFPLVGIAASKNNFKKAVDKNRARRLVSVAIQNLYPNLRNNLNLVIMPRAAILEKSPKDIEQTLKNVKAIYKSN
ncbi:ribonuclease P protein component [Candidatus Daviesbacteria bacterium]|nr:ribonuclease P protein component [Candidatus Daviesbacteria bacterium]